MSTIDTTWDQIGEKVLNNIKVHLLRHYPSEILRHYNPKIDSVVKRYSRYLPSYVAESELDDLKTIAQLEILETLKVWNPSKSEEIWPLAYVRITGAMKDHIRYITKSDPSRFYEWVSDAAYVYLTVNKRADFEHQIENGLHLKQAMEVLDLREKKIVNAYIRDDLTFQTIGQKLNISESQISRIYKSAILKIKKELKKMQDN